MMKLVEHLNAGGCVRFNRDTKKIVLVRGSLEVKDIPCSEQDIWDLIQNDLAVFYIDAPDMVFTRADVRVAVTQRNREVFQTILKHWSDTDGGLPGNCSYQDLFDLCDKFSVPRPERITEFLAWAVSQKVT